MLAYAVCSTRRFSSGTPCRSTARKLTGLEFRWQISKVRCETVLVISFRGVVRFDVGGWMRSGRVFANYFFGIALFEQMDGLRCCVDLQQWDVSCCVCFRRFTALHRRLRKMEGALLEEPCKLRACVVRAVTTHLVGTCTTQTVDTGDMPMACTTSSFVDVGFNLVWLVERKGLSRSWPSHQRVAIKRFVQVCFLLCRSSERWLSGCCDLCVGCCACIER